MWKPALDPNTQHLVLCCTQAVKALGGVAAVAGQLGLVLEGKGRGSAMSLAQLASKLEAFMRDAQQGVAGAAAGAHARSSTSATQQRARRLAQALHASSGAAAVPPPQPSPQQDARAAVLPTVRALREAGRPDLARALKQHGPTRVAAHMQLPARKRGARKVGAAWAGMDAE